MDSNTALIVDDSVTARLVLRRMLEQQDYQVDMVESGEEALVFLVHHRPGIIFMDHMMPGMDGFQAVKAIKSNPEVAAIPIVMYTSQAGGVYVGQAHALGAADILSKPPVRAELNAIFERLAANEELQPATLQAVNNADDKAPQEQADYQVLESLSNDALEETVETGVEEDQFKEAGSHGSVDTPRSFRFGKLPLNNAWIVGLLLLVILAAGIAYQVLDSRYQRLLHRQQSMLATVQWALNQSLEYPYGEKAFEGDRLLVLQELVSQLSLLQFRGRIVLEQHNGEFCKMITSEGEWMLPPAGFPIIACDAIGDDEIISGESVAFHNFLQNSPLLAEGGIRVQLVNRGVDAPYYQYPAEDKVRMVGDWNRIAQRNNRVQLRIIPDPDPDS
jgi:CheY-like chemotaxis protein